MTFEEFQATGRDVANLAEALPDMADILDGDNGGRVYAGGTFIERLGDGRWHLFIETIEWVDTDLANLERHLWDWAEGEIA